MQVNILKELNILDSFAELEADLDLALGLAPPPSTTLSSSPTETPSEYCDLIASLQAVSGEGEEW